MGHLKRSVSTGRSSSLSDTVISRSGNGANRNLTSIVEIRRFHQCALFLRRFLESMRVIGMFQLRWRLVINNQPSEAQFWILGGNFDHGFCVLLCIKNERPEV